MIDLDNFKGGDKGHSNRYSGVQRLHEQGKDNSKNKWYKQDFLIKLSFKQRGVQNWCIAES